MSKVELLVGLKIPDTTAITAHNTLKEMGFAVEKLTRYEYYEFEVEGDTEQFKKDIAQVDILVNANKNTATCEKQSGTCVLVTNNEPSTGLLNTLQNQLGFDNIKEMRTGVLWNIEGDESKAEEMASQLLANPHYQQFEVSQS